MVAEHEPQVLTVVTQSSTRAISLYAMNQYTYVYDKRFY